MNGVWRYFEFKRGISASFWLAGVHGDTVTTQHGRIGTTGQRTRTEYEDSRESAAAAERSIRGKIAKGYREVKGRVARQAVQTLRTAANQRESAHFEALRKRYDAHLEAVSSAERAERERFSKLPRKVARFLDWDGFESLVRPGRAKVAGQSRLKAVPGLPAPPPSYAQFLRRFQSVSIWHLAYRKKSWPSMFCLLSNPRMPRARHRMQSNYRSVSAAAAARWRALVPFATDGGDNWFCWDSSAVDHRGEPAIYAADNSPDPDGGFDVRRIGKDLLTVIQHYRPGLGPSS